MNAARQRSGATKAFPISAGVPGPATFSWYFIGFDTHDNEALFRRADGQRSNGPADSPVVHLAAIEVNRR
ncbi:hypothetical protein [Actinoplanes sp. NPDC051859]|uniref:hypothetical protein n=1 Tax=Actinoplanes sp. NPDC051859 TaxID=3363909 RepID=UPI00379CD683